MAYEPTQEEIDNFFDFGHASRSEELSSESLSLSVADPFHPVWTQAEAVNVENACPLSQGEMPEDFYTVTLPMYKRPNVRCKYCEDLNMECKVFTNEGNKSCFACISLFRQCSFVEDHHDPGGRVDTLHTVTEDASVEQGTLTGIRPFYAAGASMNQIKTELERRGRSRGEAAPLGSAVRFSKPTIRLLRNWLQEHAESSYPTNEQKQDLCERTGLSGTQVSNWLANARRRGKVRPKRASSPAPVTKSQPITMPTPDVPPGYAPADYLTPLERWKESPPEAEAPLAAIARAAESCDYDAQEASRSSSRSLSRRRNRLSSGSEFSVFCAQSSNSVSSQHSSDSLGSARSRGSSRGSHGSYNSFARKDRRRKRRSTPLASTTAPTVRGKRGTADANDPRPFQCTFCVDTFKHKYDWLRHEKSLHLNFEKWVCCPNGPIEQDSLNQRSTCAYCRHPNPDMAHVESHDHSACLEKGLSGRSFTRKDHLRQHLRLVHSVAMHDSMDNWKVVPEIVRSRCGFCDAAFTTWDDRAGHLAKHFREARTMAEWSGGWGFDPEVEAQVADANPHLLEAAQRSRPLASGHVEEEHAGNDTAANAHGWEVMGSILLRFVRECLSHGEEVTDAKVQQHARQTLYGNDDAWNQTCADDAHWLALFKEQVQDILRAGTTDADVAVSAGPTKAPAFSACPLLASTSEHVSGMHMDCNVVNEPPDGHGLPSDQEMSRYFGGTGTPSNAMFFSGPEMFGTSTMAGGVVSSGVTTMPGMMDMSGLTSMPPMSGPGTGAENFAMDDLMWPLDEEDVLNQQ
ncbi:MAG: hypothetical protein Q9159_000632 [Coniocarpon cinnabarinum]